MLESENIHQKEQQKAIPANQGHRHSFFSGTCPYQSLCGLFIYSGQNGLMHRPDGSDFSLDTDFSQCFVAQRLICEP